MMVAKMVISLADMWASQLVEPKELSMVIWMVV